MSLSIAVVKRFKPYHGIRRGLVDITFDTGGPTWSVAKADLGLQGGIWKLHLPAQVDGYVLADVAVSGNQTITISAMEEADGAAAMQAIDAGDLNTKVVRAEYIGY